MATRRAVATATALAILGVLAAWSLRWGAATALRDSADLMRRAEEVRLFLERVNPYVDPDCTYPPSALPVFSAVLGPIDDPLLPPLFLAINGIALAALLQGIARLQPRGWRDPATWCLVAWCLACRPIRAGLALGQFHLIPIALALGTLPRLAAGRQTAAGLLLGIALIKPTMVYPVLLVWLFTGQWRALAAAVGVQAALTLGSSLWLGEPVVSLVRGWVENARGQLDAGTIDLATLLGGLRTGVGPRLVGSIVMGGLAVGLLWKARRAALGHQTALALGLAAVGTYHRHYELGLLLPAIAVLLGEAAAVSRAPRLATLSRCLAFLLAVFLLLPTNPVWIRRWTPLVDGGVAVLSYLVIGLMYLRSLAPASVGRTCGEDARHRHVSAKARGRAGPDLASP